MNVDFPGRRGNICPGNLSGYMCAFVWDLIGLLLKVDEEDFVILNMQKRWKSITLKEKIKT